ncbi:acyltransferase domain-containing protein, partial [Amycolatopsis sp. NPDC004079]|uniref:acyltransferase domain-containing protein n=1 Tax=Amycolatopsis sp. NPDC004079 TaxID=3154549 RepID=UPI0033A03679
ALRDQARDLAGHVARNPGLELDDAARALARRTRFEHGAAVVAADRGALLGALNAVATGDPHPDVLVPDMPGPEPAEGGGKTVFVFPGQGPQWPGMGRDLAAASPVFARHLHDCAEAFAPYLDYDLLDLLTTDTPLDTPRHVQPALFAMMVSLARTWQHAGITPDAVIGHSQGEIAAAHIAGALTLTDAARIITHRTATLAAITGRGAMASLNLPHDHAAALLPPTVSIAAANSPRTTVVSGDPDAIARLVDTCTRQGIHARTIPVDYASHSPHIDPLRHQLLTALHDITPAPADIPFYSTVTADRLDTTQLTARYWYDNLRNPVQFTQTITTLTHTGHTRYIETSPHPVLTTPIHETHHHTTTIPTLHRNKHTPTQLLHALTHAHLTGLTVHW